MQIANTKHKNNKNTKHKTKHKHNINTKIQGHRE